jgi:hypothetical protein
MPAIIDTSRAYVTMGETCDAPCRSVGYLARDAGLLRPKLFGGLVVTKVLREYARARWTVGRSRHQARAQFS